ncbi:MAG: hypothetical protein Q4D16_10720 [Eubacteriales bacterium]|nr:hypothetical protein [Eubacteriales bacterium]
MSKNHVIDKTNKDILRVAVIIEEGIISAAYSSTENIKLEIVELDKDYASIEERNAAYESYNKDIALSPCEYELILPGYYESLELEEEK